MYTTEFSVLAPPPARLSRYWTFNVFFYQWLGSQTGLAS